MDDLLRGMRTNPLYGSTLAAIEKCISGNARLGAGGAGGHESGRLENRKSIKQVKPLTKYVAINGSHRLTHGCRSPAEGQERGRSFPSVRSTRTLYSILYIKLVLFVLVRVRLVYCRLHGGCLEDQGPAKWRPRVEKTTRQTGLRERGVGRDTLATSELYVRADSS